jgi:hypothetical protein
VCNEPTPRGTAHDLALEDLELRDPNFGDGPRPGRMLVRVPRAFAAQAGDQVALEVTLRAADTADPEEAAYRERLRRQGIGALGNAWELRVIGHRSIHCSRPRPVSALAARRTVRTVPEPEASLGAGILLGVRGRNGPGHP